MRFISSSHKSCEGQESPERQDYIDMHNGFKPMTPSPPSSQVLNILLRILFLVSLSVHFKVTFCGIPRYQETLTLDSLVFKFKVYLDVDYIIGFFIFEGTWLHGPSVNFRHLLVTHFSEN